MDGFWLIKDRRNRILGPYKEEEIISHIHEGRFEGRELLSSYPSGEWKPISSNPTFYDEILKALNQKSSPKKEKSEIINDANDEDSIMEPTIIISKDKLDSKDEKKSKKKQVKISLERLNQDLEEDEEDDLDYEDEGSRIIQMTDTENTFSETISKIIRPSLIAIGIAAIGFFAYNFSPSNSNKNTQIRLLTIQKKRAPWKLEELQQKLRKAIFYYSKDEVSSYSKSQDQLIQILEGNFKDSVPYYYLCLTQLELWPFSYQDTRDQRTFSDVLGRINKINKGGVYSGLCNSVKNLIDKKYAQAIMVINSSLDALGTESPVFFYYLKAKALRGLNKNNEARNYFQTIHKLLPKWLAPYMLSAQMDYEEGKYGAALKKYQKILQISPAHVPAGLRLGILEYKFLKNPNQSEKRLRSFLQNESEIIDPVILLEAYKSLMNIYASRKQDKMTLTYAKKVYSLNPLDRPTIILLTNLGYDKSSLNKIQTQSRQLIHQGDVLVNQGKCNEAQNYYEKAYLSERRGNALAAIKIAKCLWQLNVSGQAIKWLKKAISADPKMVEAYFLLVDYLSSRYDFENALKILNIASKQNPSSYEIFKSYSLLAFRKKQYQSAIGYGKRALKIYSSDVEIYVLLNKSYRALGDYNQAYIYAKQSIEEDVNNVSGQIGYALALGSAYGFSRGEDYFKNLIRNFPFVVEYSQALGKYYFEDEKYQESLKFFLSFINNHPDFKMAYIYLGRIYSILGERGEDAEKYKLAVKYLLKASLLDTSDPEPLFHIGRVYMLNKKYQEAENQYERVLQLNSNYPLIHYYLGYINFLQDGDDNLNRALEFAKTESTKNPNLSLSYVLKGDIYKRKALGASDSVHVRRSYYELCAKEYQQAIRIRNTDIKFYIKLISCYKGAGDFDSALQVANQVIERDGTSGYPELYRQLGQIYEVKGNYRRAQVIYETYFSLMPSAPDKKEIENRLQKYILKEEKSIK